MCLVSVRITPRRCCYTLLFFAFLIVSLSRLAAPVRCRCADATAAGHLQSCYLYYWEDDRVERGGKRDHGFRASRQFRSGAPCRDVLICRAHSPTGRPAEYSSVCDCENKILVWTFSPVHTMNRSVSAETTAAAAAAAASSRASAHFTRRQRPLLLLTPCYDSRYLFLSFV